MSTMDTDTPDPRSRFHRACIHIGWFALLCACFGLVLSTKSAHRGNWLVAVDTITSLTSLVVAFGICWLIHAKPPGQKLDFICGPSRRPGKYF